MLHVCVCVCVRAHTHPDGERRERERQRGREKESLCVCVCVCVCVTGCSSRSAGPTGRSAHVRRLPPASRLPTPALPRSLPSTGLRDATTTTTWLPCSTPAGWLLPTCTRLPCAATASARTPYVDGTMQPSSPCMRMYTAHVDDALRLALFAMPMRADQTGQTGQTGPRMQRALSDRACIACDHERLSGLLSTDPAAGHVLALYIQLPSRMQCNACLGVQRIVGRRTTAITRTRAFAVYPTSQ